MTRYYNVFAKMNNGETEGVITDNCQVALNRYIDYTKNAESVHITDLATGEVYAYFDRINTDWGPEVKRGVAREFTEILVGLRV